MNKPHKKENKKEIKPLDPAKYLEFTLKMESNIKQAIEQARKEGK